jgi:hypothetical protein
VFYVIPSCARSIFRYRLWRLRDDLVDDLRGGTFEDVEQPRRLVREVETAIRAARDLTVFRVVLFTMLARGHEPPEREEVDLSVLSKPDRERLGRYMKTFHWLLTRHVLAGTVSGWIFTAIVFPLAAIAVTYRSLRIFRSTPLSVPRIIFKQAKRNVRREVDIDAALPYLSERDRRAKQEKLSAFV